MLNAAGALIAARKPIASVALPASFPAGGNVSLMGSRSVASCGRTITDYAWTVQFGAAIISNPAVADTSVIAPSGTDFYVVRLTVTDDQGDTDTVDITITPTDASSNAPTITPVNSCPTPITIAQIPIPTATLTANPMTVMSGRTTTLTWSSTDATGCTASGAWSGAKSASGSQSSGALTASGTFTIACDGAGGTSNLHSVTVTVTAAPSGGGGGGGGGGGLLGGLSLFGLSAVLAASRRRIRH